MMRDLRQRKRFRFADAIIMVLIIIAAVSVIVYNHRPVNGDLIAIVRVNSEEILTVNLENVNQPYRYCVEGEINVIIEIGHNMICVVSSECEDQVCVKTGKLTKAGQSAVCLPAKLSVEIVGSDSMQLDGVVG